MAVKGSLEGNRRTPNGDAKRAKLQARFEGYWLHQWVRVYVGYDLDKGGDATGHAPRYVEEVRYVGNSVYGIVVLRLRNKKEDYYVETSASAYLPKLANLQVVAAPSMTV